MSQLAGGGSQPKYGEELDYFLLTSLVVSSHQERVTPDCNHFVTATFKEDLTEANKI